MKTIGLLAAMLVLLHPPLQAWGDEPMCRRVAGILRSLDVDDVPRDEDILDVLEARSAGYIEIDARHYNDMPFFEDLHPTRQLRATLNQVFITTNDGKYPDATLVWLDKTTGAVEGLVGHMACSAVVFFQTHDGFSHEIPPPAKKWFANLDGCLPSVAITGRVAQIPVFIEEINSQTLAKMELKVTPWVGDRWHRTCDIEAQFTPVLYPEAFAGNSADCRPGSDCDRLATRLKEFSEAHYNFLDESPGRSKLSAASRSLANATGDLGRMPSFSDPTRRVELNDYALYDVTLDGVPYIVLLGEDTNSPYFDGFWTELWQPGKDRLEPVGSFRWLWGRGHVSSVTISSQ